MRRSGALQHYLLLTLTVATTALAYLSWRAQVSTLLEAISVVTGALCVWLTVRESLWNFPISLVNVSAFFVVFFKARLFADASLQVVYFGLTLYGWYLWLYGGNQKSALRVSRSTPRSMLTVAVTCVALTFTLWFVLRLVGGSASFFDAITTALSLCAQWLLDRKRVENWFYWIAADLIYIPLYAYKHLYLTAGLYAVFLAMCFIGVREWRESLRRNDDPEPRGFEVIPLEASA